MAKKILGYIKLQVPAGSATPSPPIGPALGQRGVNIMGFVKEFNARTEKEVKGTPLPTVITVYQVHPEVERLLRETNLTIDLIAEQTGFTHSHYLQATFKARYKQTPGKFRRAKA